MPSAARKLSTSGLIRVCIENGMEFLRGARSSIAGPRYKIVQITAAHVGRDSEMAPTPEALADLEITLSTCLQFVRQARFKRLGSREQTNERERACL